MPARMNQEQVVHLHSVLSFVCTKGEDGYAVYAEGCDDSTVMRDVNKNNPTGREYTLKHVSGLRLSMFGKLRGAVQATFDAQLKDMSARIDAIEAWLRSHTGGRYGKPVSTPPSTKEQ